MQLEHRNGLMNGLDTIIIAQILDYLLQNNLYAKIYQRAGERLKENESIDFKIAFRADTSSDRRRYNAPTVDELAVIIPGNESNLGQSTIREIIVYLKDGTLRNINVNHSSYDPLYYVLMHPKGEQGWQANSIDLKLSEKSAVPATTTTTKSVPVPATTTTTTTVTAPYNNNIYDNDLNQLFDLSSKI